MSNEDTINRKLAWSGSIDLTNAYPDVRRTAYEMQERGEVIVRHTEHGGVFAHRAPKQC